MSVSYIYTSENISAFVNGRVFTVHNSNPKFAAVLEALKANQTDNELFNLFKEAEAIANYLNKAATPGEGEVVFVHGDTVYIHGEPASGPIVDKIRQFRAEGLDARPLVNYLKKLADNPSRRAVEELYTFLERENLPITPEGNLLAYKAVNNAWNDKHTGKISNAIGNVLEMPRNQVSDDCNAGCSYGYHAGSLKYVRSFACGYGKPDGDRIIIVEIDPRDVVSIPKDSEYSKMRVCKYKVTAEFQGELPKALVTDSARPYDVADEADEDDSSEADEDSY